MRTIFTRLAAVAILLLAMELSHAQDIHFSQFYASPLTLNPAMTGNIAGGYRAAVNYRNQWSSIPAPYSTIAGSFDISVLQCQLGIDHVGLGLAFYNDRAGDGNLNELTGLFSVAYHKGFDPEKRYVLALGGQAGFTQKSVDFNKLIFGNQINDEFQADPTLPNGEPIANTSFSYLDFRGGGLFTAAVNDQVNFYLGGAYNHFTKPTEQFLDNNGTVPVNKLDTRLVVHGGGSFFLNEQFSISPSILFMQQTGSQEINAGAALGYHFGGDRYSGPGAGVYLGGWYRVQDAVILVVGADYQNFRLGLSYDINVSDLKVASSSQGGFELALNYVGRLPECQKKMKLYCPRF